MIVIQTVLALLIRSLRRVINTAIGWATVMLFGRRAGVSESGGVGTVDQAAGNCPRTFWTGDVGE